MEQMWLIAQEVAEKIFDHFQQLQPQIVGALQSGIDQLTRPPDSPTGLELRLADLQETLLARDNELAISRKQIQDLQMKLVRKENENAALMPLRSRVSSLKFKLLEKDAEGISQIQDLQMKLVRKENENAALMPLRSRVSSLEFKLLEKDAEGISQIQDLQMKLAREENARAALVPLQLRVDFLEFKLLQKEGEIVAAQQGLHGKLERMETEKLQSCMAQISHLEKQLAQKESERVLMAQRFATQPQVDGETWQYQTSRGKWISFPEPANKELIVKARENHDAFQIVIDERTYDIEFKKGKKEVKIRCFVGLPSLPLHWNARLHQGLSGNLMLLKKVTGKRTLERLAEVLNGSRARHDGTVCKCVHGSSNFIVTEAYQVRNLHLWRRYHRCIRSICDKHRQYGISPEHIRHPPSKALIDFATDIDVDQASNELLLLHGTPHFDVAKVIATEGFDHRVAGNGLYGQGTYFAAQTCKAAQYATVHGMSLKASTQLVGTMLLARVAIGDPFYTQSEWHFSRPPEKNGVRADSIIARPGTSHGPSAGRQNHLEVVTFDPAQAYPEFIVNFVEK